MYTQADLDKLEAAIVRGASRVTFSDGRTVEFSTFDELVKRTNYVRQQLYQSDAQNRKLAKFSKGVQA